LSFQSYLIYAASFPLNPQIWQADLSLQLLHTFSLSIIAGNWIKIALIVLVMGWPRDQAILLNVADDDSFNSGV